MTDLKQPQKLTFQLKSGLCLVALIITIAILAPWLAPYDPYVQDLAIRLQLPVWTSAGHWAHPFGTDGFGRDYLSRLIYGGRISISIAVIVVAISAPIGILLGLIGGYFGGRIDAFIMFIITTRLSLPVVLVTLAIVSITGGSFITAALVLGLLFWDRFAVVIRAATQQLRARQFILAARATGASHLQVIAREVLPNVGMQVLAISTVENGTCNPCGGCTVFPWIRCAAAISILGVNGGRSSRFILFPAAFGCFTRISDMSTGTWH